MREVTDEHCDRLCGNCACFRVLDDQPGDPCKWFGVCDREAACSIEDKDIDWVYDHGRHGNDDCECPDEWFEEG
jgi:hypothetical protein